MKGLAKRQACRACPVPAHLDDRCLRAGETQRQRQAGGIAAGVEYEIGIAAWGIGFLAGFGVVRFAGGAKGTPLQVVAVVSSLVGIVIGKYISYAYFFKQAVSDRFDVDLSYFDSQIFRAFRENLGDVFGGFDLIWAGLAVVTAWKLTRPSGFGSRGRVGV